MDTGENIDHANAWWWDALGRVTKVVEPDTARVMVVRAEQARVAAEEAKRRAAEAAARKAEEDAEAARLQALEDAAAGPSSAPATPSKRGKKSGPAGKSPAKKSPGKKSPAKKKGKSAGTSEGDKGKGKGGRIPDEWDSDDSEFEDEEEELSEEEVEEEPPEESLEEQYVRFFKQHLEAATNGAYNAAGAATNGLTIRDRFHTVAQMRELLRKHFRALATCASASAAVTHAAAALRVALSFHSGVDAPGNRDWTTLARAIVGLLVPPALVSCALATPV